jgi:hypothetical protein
MATPLFKIVALSGDHDFPFMIEELAIGPSRRRPSLSRSDICPEKPRQAWLFRAYA